MAALFLGIWLTRKPAMGSLLGHWSAVTGNERRSATRLQHHRALSDISARPMARILGHQNARTPDSLSRVLADQPLKCAERVLAASPAASQSAILATSRRPQIPNQTGQNGHTSLRWGVRLPDGAATRA